jgi:hypothetical protein
MKHVFVESNWVFDFSAPAHLRTPDAQSLATYANAGLLRLYVPGICLREGEDAVRRKCAARNAKDLLEFRRWAVQQGNLSQNDSDAASPLLERYLGSMQSGLADLCARVNSIRSLPGVEVFALSEAMLERAITLRPVADLKPFDEAILAAVLEKSKELPSHEPKFFCELDGDLATHDRKGKPRKAFVDLYDQAGIVFRSDFQVS